MSFSTLKPATCRIPPEIGANGSHSKREKITLVKREIIPPLQVNATSQSRREFLGTAVASFSFASVLLMTSSAEARPKNSNMKQKIMEKWRQIREKAGLGNTKDEEEIEDKEKKIKDDDEEKNKKIIPNILTVETSLP